MQSRSEQTSKRSYDVGMLTLLEAGLLSAGTRLHANHHGRRYEAVVRSDGRLDLPGTATGLSVSGAAKLLTGRATNGWAVWLAPQSDGSVRSLRRLRADLIARHSEN